MKPTLNVLLVEDSEEDAVFLIRKLRKGGFDLTWERVQNADVMIQALNEKQWDLILSDYSMPSFTGLQALEIYKRYALEIPFIIVSGTVGEDVAVEAMKEGAHDYLMKDKLERLIPAVNRELREAKIRRERIQNLNLLKEREEFLTAIIENIPHMIFIKDAKNLHFVRINKAVEELLGISREALIGKSDHDLFTEEEADFFTATDRDTLVTRQLLEIPVETIKTKTKGVRILHTKKIPILNEEGTPLFLLGLSEDITQKIASEKLEKDLTNQLRQAQKLESLGNLAGGIAHDFNNILSAIIGYSELARTSVLKGSEAEIGLLEVLKASTRAADLVRRILAFSRRSESEFIPIDLKTVVMEALGLLRSSIPSSIEIKEHLENGIIMGDPTQIHQVVMNLCTNAYHSMRADGGVLTISLFAVDVDEQMALSHAELNAGPAMKLVVADTGHGIKESVVERIFEPYYTTKEKGEGTGLGLSVVHGIVRSHFGAVMVESTVNEGSVFTVYFPRIEHTNKKENVEKRQNLPTGNERLLFVDDETILVELGKAQLEKLGYEVATKIDGRQALEQFKSNPAYFDLVITDMTMPKISGDKLAMELMKIRPDIPIILCTGYSDRICKEKADEIGIEEFVYKPFTLEKLAITVRIVLDRSKNRS